MHDAFERFIREHQNMVYSTAMRITYDPMEAEDISQQVFLQAYSRFSDLQKHENPGGWLRLTTRNLSINHVKRHLHRWSFFNTVSELPANIESELQNVSNNDDWLYDQSDLIKEALGSLPDKLRAPLVLFYYEGLQYQEIAEVLGFSIGKVKTDIFRAKKAVKEYIERLEKKNATAA